MNRLTVIFATFLCATLFAPALAINSNVRFEWVLSQRHDESGDFEIYIASDAVKVVSRVNSGVVVAKAPDWKVVCYRLDDKVQWSTSLDTFHGLNSTVINHSERRFEILPKLRVVSKGKDHGINYSCYYDRIDRVAWLADDIKVESEVADVICRYFSVPAYNSHQIILRFGALPQRTPEKGPQSEVLKKNAWSMDNMVNLDFEHRGNFKIQTLAARKIQYNAADFEYPKNLKQVKTLTEVLMSQSQKSELVDFLNDLGFTPTSKTPAK